MDAFRSVARAMVDGGRRLLAQPFALLVPVLGAVVMFGLSVCVLPFFLGIFMLGRAVEDAVPAPRRTAGTAGLVGLCMFGVVAVPSAGMAVAAASLDVGAAFGVGHVVAVLIVPILGLLIGPFVTAGPHLARRGGGADDAFGRALAGATAAGWLTSLLRGGVMGIGALTVPLFTLAMHAVLGDGGLGGMGALVCQCLSLWIVGSWQVAFACACADQDDVRLTGAATPTAGVRLMLAPLVAIVFLAGAMGAAAMKPLGPWQRRPPTPLTCEPSLEDHGPQGLSVRPRVDGDRSSFLVETADGGGVGTVVDGAGRETLHVCLDTQDVVWLVWGEITLATEEYDTLYVPIDARGVRLDDGISDRLTVRTGTFFGVSVVLGLCLLLIGLWQLGRRSALLDVMSRPDDALRTARGRVALAGGKIQPTGEVEGAPQFDSDDGSHAFSLPPRIRLLGVERAITKDTAALLIATERLDSLSLRDGLARWPRSAILIVGKPEDARGAITAELTRVVGLWAAAAAVAFGVAAVSLLASL